MSTEKKKLEIYLRVSSQRSEGDYFHLDAEPIYRGKNYRGEEAWMTFDDYANPNGLYLNNFQITSQGDGTTRSDDGGSPRLYAWDVEYISVYKVDLDVAKRMASTLTTIDKRLRKMTDTLGRPATFGAYVARVAAAIGATVILTPPSVKRQRRGFGYSTDELRSSSPGDGASAIDRLVAEWQNPPVVVSQAV